MNQTLGGIYNPQEMPEAEFLARYSVRLELTQKLLQDILASGPEQEPSHFVIQGQRGQGKTSLLRRLYLTLRDSAETNDWLVPILFKEELYGVTGLCRLWEEAGRQLQGHPAGAGLAESFEAAWESPHYDKDCHLILDQALQRTDNRLVLLIDNLGDLFAKLDRREQQRLREILHTTRRIQIVGASTAMLEQHYDHGAPFYQFFRQINLPGLDHAEALTLLRHLGTQEQKERLEQIIAESPGRIETLRRLTAGVPRTLVLLFEILLDPDGTAFRDLELLLDRVTPLYKHRMDDLPPQQQAITDAVALGWDAVSTKEVARATRLPGKQVSAQLKQLERANIIHRQPTSTKNHLYRLEERFFNIWYLMRHGRPGDRRRTLWLVRFLESWCTPQELRERAGRHLEMIAGERLQPEYAWFMTEALRGAGLDPKTELQLIFATRDYLPVTLRADFDRSTMEQLDQKLEQLKLRVEEKRSENEHRVQLLEKAKQLEESLRVGDYQGALSLFEKIPDTGNVSLMIIGARLYRKFERYEDAERLYHKAAEQGHVAAMHELASLYHEHLNRIDDAEHWWREAAGRGDIKAKLQLALFDFERTPNPEEALANLLQALSGLDDSDVGSYVIVLAAMLFWEQKFPAAFAVLERALPDLDLEQNSQPISMVLTILLASGQTAYMRRLFEGDEFVVYRFRDRFKPFYYALLVELGEPRSDDLRRMGPELAETVAEIGERVIEWREKYFHES